MDFSNFPVLDTLDLQAITFDAVKFPDDTYGLIINFWKVFPLGEHKKSDPEGLIFCTQVIDDDLPGIYEKIQTIISTGMLEGPTIYLNGNMWSHDGELIGEIAWYEFTDDHYIISELEELDEESVVDGEETIFSTYHKPPKTLQ